MFNFIVEYYKKFNSVEEETDRLTALKEQFESLYPDDEQEMFRFVRLITRTANYLEATSLLNDMTKLIATIYLKGKTTEEMRIVLGIRPDQTGWATPEEEENARKNIDWGLAFKCDENDANPDQVA